MQPVFMQGMCALPKLLGQVRQPPCGRCWGVGGVGVTATHCAGRRRWDNHKVMVCWLSRFSQLPGQMRHTAMWCLLGVGWGGGGGDRVFL